MSKEEISVRDAYNSSPVVLYGKALEVKNVPVYSTFFLRPENSFNFENLTLPEIADSMQRIWTDEYKNKLVDSFDFNKQFVDSYSFPTKEEIVDYKAGLVYKKRIKFEVLEIYKGDISEDTLLLYTGYSGADCGYPFISKKKYVVYSNRRDLFDKSKEKALYTTICDRTTDNVKEEIDSLAQILDK